MLLALNLFILGDTVHKSTGTPSCYKKAHGLALPVPRNPQVLWVLLAKHLSGFYLTKLWSTEIAPLEEDLAKRQFAFYADTETVKVLREKFGEDSRESFNSFTGKMPIDIGANHFQLAELLHI